MVGEAPTTTTPPQLAAEKYMVGMLLADAEAIVLYGFWNKMSTNSGFSLLGGWFDDLHVRGHPFLFGSDHLISVQSRSRKSGFWPMCIGHQRKYKGFVNEITSVGVDERADSSLVR